MVILWWFLAITLIGLLISWILGSIIILENDDPKQTTAWLAGLFAFPLIGMLFYLIVGRHPFKRKRLQTKSVHNRRIQQTAQKQFQLFIKNERFLDGIPSKKLMRLLLGNAAIPLTMNNSTEVLTNGDKKFSALLAELEAAQDHIHMEYYIFRSDEIGTEVRDILVRKAAENVKVRLVLDGMGCRTLPKSFIQSMRDADIEVEFFFPVHFPYLTSRLNYRNHRKIVIIDGKTGFLGGLNVGDEYLSRTVKYGFWRDTHLKIQGDAVHYLQTVFLSDWYFLTRNELLGERYFPQIPPVGRQAIQIVASGPDSDCESVRQLFFSALANADSKVYLVTPYFVPDEGLLLALQTAALSGLDVRVIIQGKPDHKFTYWAGRSYYESILEAGVKVYEYQKGVLHAKVLMADNLGILGSANFDIRSFQLNFEVSALIYNPHFVRELEKNFWEDLDDSTEIFKEEFARRPGSERYKESLARLLSPLL